MKALISDYDILPLIKFICRNLITDTLRPNANDSRSRPLPPFTPNVNGFGHESYFAFPEQSLFQINNNYRGRVTTEYHSGLSSSVSLLWS